MSKPSAFFFYTFHKSFTEAENLAVVLEIERLCEEIMRTQFADEFSKEVMALRTMLQVFPRNIQPAKLQEVLRKLRSLGVMTDMFLSALVAVEYDVDFSPKSQDDLPLSERVSVYEQYKPLVVLLCFRLLEQLDYVPEVPRATDEIRRVIAGQRRDNYTLPNLSEVVDLEKLVSQIRFNNKIHESRYGGIYSFVKLTKDLNVDLTRYFNRLLNFNSVQKKTDKEKIQAKNSQQFTIKTGRYKAKVSHKDVDCDFGDDINADPPIEQDQAQVVKLQGNRTKPNAVSRYQAEAIAKRISAPNAAYPAI